MSHIVTLVLPNLMGMRFSLDFPSLTKPDFLLSRSLSFYCQLILDRVHRVDDKHARHWHWHHQCPPVVLWCSLSPIGSLTQLHKRDRSHGKRPQIQRKWWWTHGAHVTWAHNSNDMRHKAMMHQNNVTCQPCNRCLHKHKKNNVSQHKCNLCPRYQPSVIKDNKCLSLCFINLIYFISLNFWLKNWYWISPSPWFLGHPPIYNRSTKARFLVLVFHS